MKTWNKNEFLEYQSSLSIHFTKINEKRSSTQLLRDLKRDFIRDQIRDLYRDISFDICNSDDLNWNDANWFDFWFAKWQTYCEGLDRNSEKWNDYIVKNGGSISDSDTHRDLIRDLDRDFGRDLQRDLAEYRKKNKIK